MKKTIISAACAFAALAAFASHGGGPSYPNFGLPRVEEMMFLVLQIGVIIFAARLGGAIASMLKMPSILGELAAGIVIGPWALGGIGFGDGVFAHGLFNGAALRGNHFILAGCGGREQNPRIPGSGVIIRRFVDQRGGRFPRHEGSIY